MGDQFERFIMENKDAFSEAEPSKEIWNKIDKRINKRYRSHTIWKIAAVLFLTSTILLVLDRTKGDSTTPQLSQEFIEAEEYYVSLIDQRKNLLIEETNQEDGQLFLDEIKELDLMYLELKNTYQTNASNERVLDAMINNLQLRLNILNQQLEILEKVNNQTNEKETII